MKKIIHFSAKKQFSWPLKKTILRLSAEKNNSPLERWKKKQKTIFLFSAEKKTILLSADKNSPLKRWKKIILLLCAKKTILRLSAEKNNSPLESFWALKKKQFSWALKKLLLLSAEKNNLL